MKVAADQKCFICGPDNPVGLKTEFTVDPELKRAETTLSLPELYQGWQGVVHGGIISALLDETAIYACRPLSLQAVTADLRVRFRKPVPTGCEVRVVADLVSVKRKFADVRSVLLIGEDVMAEAEVKIMLMHEKEARS